jgi:hypothetical protein
MTDRRNVRAGRLLLGTLSGPSTPPSEASIYVGFAEYRLDDFRGVNPESNNSTSANR